MENSNAHQPVPATEEVVEKLPRVVLEDGCTSCSHARRDTPIDSRNCQPRCSRRIALSAKISLRWGPRILMSKSSSLYLASILSTNHAFSLG